MKAFFPRTKFPLKWLMALCIIMIPPILNTRHILVYQAWPIIENYDELFFKDEITLFDKRLAELRKFLPPHGLVTFIEGHEINPKFEVSKFQFALAPIIVDAYRPHLFAVGSFPPERLIGHAYFKGEKYTVVQGFGEGILLLKRERQ